MEELKANYHINNPDTKVYVGDNRKILHQLAKESVDLVFADPPFNWEVSYYKWKDNSFFVLKNFNLGTSYITYLEIVTPNTVHHIENNLCVFGGFISAVDLD